MKQYPVFFAIYGIEVGRCLTRLVIHPPGGWRWVPLGVDRCLTRLVNHPHGGRCISLREGEGG